MEEVSILGNNSAKISLVMKDGMIFNNTLE
jgi:hypothetical protein